MKRRINQNTTLAKVLEIEGTEKVLAKYNLPCLTCPFAKMEMENLKIGQVCKMYGIDEKKLLKELNKKT